MILIITDSIPTPTYQRSGIFAYDDFQFYRKQGIDVKMIILFRITYERRFLFNFKKQVDFIDQQVKEINSIIAFNPNIEFIPYLSFIKPFVFKEDLFLYKNSKFNKLIFDQVTVHNMLHTGLNISWIKKQFPHTKIILKEHDNWLIYRKLVRYFAVKSINKYDKILANSEYTRQSFLKIFSDYKKQINGSAPIIEIDYPKFNINTNKIIKTKSSALQLLTVANLIKAKGFEESFSIFEILEESNISWFWTIIGKGPFYETIIKLAAKLNITHKISVLPEIQKPFLYDYMQRSDIYLQLSYRETFGIAPIEAFSYYNKLIVSDHVTSIKELGLKCNKNILIIKDINNIKSQKKNILRFIQKRVYDEDFEQVLPRLNSLVNTHK